MNREADTISKALGLEDPWYLESTEMVGDGKDRHVEIRVGYRRGAGVRPKSAVCSTTAM